MENKLEGEKMDVTLSITEFMMRDHNRLIDLFNDFKNTKNRDFKKAKELFLRFDMELRKHFITEEKIIKSSFKKTKKEKGNLLPIATSLKSEHKEIDTILRKILDILFPPC